MALPLSITHTQPQSATALSSANGASIYAPYSPGMPIWQVLLIVAGIALLLRYLKKHG